MDRPRLAEKEQEKPAVAPLAKTCLPQAMIARPPWAFNLLFGCPNGSGGVQGKKINVVLAKGQRCFKFAVCIYGHRHFRAEFSVRNIFNSAAIAGLKSAGLPSSR